MKIYTMVRMNIDTGETLAEESFEYDGPLALCYGGENEPGGGWGDDEGYGGGWGVSKGSTYGADPTGMAGMFAGTELGQDFGEGFFDSGGGYEQNIAISKSMSQFGLIRDPAKRAKAMSMAADAMRSGQSLKSALGSMWKSGVISSFQELSALEKSLPQVWDESRKGLLAADKAKAKAPVMKQAEQLGLKGFDPAAYLDRYPDLKKAYGDTNIAFQRALDHYRSFGKKEGRIATAEPADDLSRAYWYMNMPAPNPPESGTKSLAEAPAAVAPADGADPTGMAGMFAGTELGQDFGEGFFDSGPMDMTAPTPPESGTKSLAEAQAAVDQADRESLKAAINEGMAWGSLFGKLGAVAGGIIAAAAHKIQDGMREAQVLAELEHEFPGEFIQNPGIENEVIAAANEAISGADAEGRSVNEHLLDKVTASAAPGTAPGTTPGTVPGTDGIIRGDLSPWRVAGQNALKKYAGMVDAGPGDYTKSPGYDFRFNEGLNALQRTQAAKGKLNSGETDKWAIQYGQDFATNDYDNFLNRYYQSLEPHRDLSKTGQVSAAQEADLRASSETQNQMLTYNQDLDRRARSGQQSQNWLDLGLAAISGYGSSYDNDNTLNKLTSLFS